MVSKKRLSSSSTLILFTILYISIFFKTLHIHHHSNIRPILQFGPSRINDSNDHIKKRRRVTEHTHDVSAIDMSYAHDIMSTNRTQEEDGIDVSAADISAKQKHIKDNERI